MSGSDDPSPIAIVDVGYDDRLAGGPESRSPAPEAFVGVERLRPPMALAACVVAQRWADAEPTEVQVVTVAEVRPYAPGRFYERELPCLLAVLERLRTAVEVIVVDGYAILDEHGTPGLGAHLHARLGGEKAVVGVAKTAYRGSGFATAVLRGASLRPLYVTAMGMEVEHAARLVASMHGDHRIPTLLGLVDRLARGTVSTDQVACSMQ